ncbi:MAG TPA: cyclase family protein [Solirubrobacteraceae bacterium]|nr:cyclase family protein [Solirubrobacteraceae bacterium]
MDTWSGGSVETSAWFPAAGNVRVYDLAVALEAGMARHPAHPPFSFVLMKKHGEHAYPGGLTATSEMFSTGGHVGTHVDALGHVAIDGCIHGGHDVMAGQSYTGGLAVGSVEEVPPLIGRGHLVDGEALFGRQMTPSDSFGPAELSDWFTGAAGRTEPGPGSMVLLRTGWMARHWSVSADAYIGLETGLPGLSLDGARWLSERGILAAGSDTMNLEHKVAGVVCLEVHKWFLVQSGIYIMESLALDALAGDGVREFFFAAAPLRIRGGTGSPIRPMAVVER